MDVDKTSYETVIEDVLAKCFFLISCVDVRTSQTYKNKSNIHVCFWAGVFRFFARRRTVTCRVIPKDGTCILHVDVCFYLPMIWRRCLTFFSKNNLVCGMWKIAWIQMEGEGWIGTGRANYITRLSAMPYGNTGARHDNLADNSVASSVYRHCKTDLHTTQRASLLQQRWCSANSSMS